MLRNQKMPSSLENIFLKRGEKKASTSLVRKLLCLRLCVADGAAAAVGSMCAHCQAAWRARQLG